MVAPAVVYNTECHEGADCVPCEIGVCSNVAGEFSATYPCKCGTTAETTKLCTDDEVCVASNDIDAMCQKKTRETSAATRVGGLVQFDIFDQGNTRDSSFTLTAGDLKKAHTAGPHSNTDGYAFNGPKSDQSFTANDTHGIAGVSFAIMKNNKKQYMGLGNKDSPEIDFAFYITRAYYSISEPSVFIYEGGKFAAYAGHYEPGSTFVVRVNYNGQMEYYVDGERRWTSYTTDIKYPLSVETRFESDTSHISNVKWVGVDTDVPAEDEPAQCRTITGDAGKDNAWAKCKERSDCIFWYVAGTSSSKACMARKTCAPDQTSRRRLYSSSCDELKTGPAANIYWCQRQEFRETCETTCYNKGHSKYFGGVSANEEGQGHYYCQLPK